MADVWPAGRRSPEGRHRKLTGPGTRRGADAGAGPAHGREHPSACSDDDELREISIVMSSLGTYRGRNSGREALPLEFVGSHVGLRRRDLGNYDATERLLQQYLPAERRSTKSWTISAVPPAATCGTSSPM